MSKGARGVRYAEIDRETPETRVHVVLDLDGGTKQDITTGIAFFDHMLELLAYHARFDLGVEAEGDLGVDDHHTVEDVGIALGRAIREALAETDPIARLGSSFTPMDEALVATAVDFSGRGQCYFEGEFKMDRLGQMSTQSIPEFFRALSQHGGMTIHQKVMRGSNDHHIAEALFKGLGIALSQATQTVDRRAPSSTKGKLD
jgi:imidazoleglycerol-phosphate dehydratase